MLTKEQLVEIKTLQSVCEADGEFLLKLNFEMLENRSADHQEDFFHYEDGMLVGFLGLYHFGNKIELCGMVHPNCRRKGIFTSLLSKGLGVAEKCGVEILLNAPAESSSASAFLKTIPCTFVSAEYQMIWERTDLTEDPTVQLRLADSEEDDEAEIELEVACFGFKESEAREFHQRMKENSTEHRYIIEAEGKTAGKLRVSERNGEAWIYSFAIYPELQGRGIGRKALTNLVIIEHQKGLPIFLEVEAQNAHALKLYQTCGFKTYHSQNYFGVRPPLL